MFSYKEANHIFTRGKFRWTLNRKISGLTAGLLLILGGVTLYSHFEINEINRELEEIGQSDFPLYETTTQLLLLQLQQQHLFDKLEYSYHNADDYHAINSSQINQKLVQTQRDITNTLTTGAKQAQFALQQEQIKEDDIRLNQVNEDYHQLKLIFLELDSENQKFSLIIEKIIQKNNSQTIYSSTELFNQAKQRLEVSEKLAQDILVRLKTHVEGSVTATNSEKTLAVRNNVLIAFVALLFGTTFSTILTRKITSSINQITYSIERVTQQAEFIAQNIDHETLISESLIVDTNDDIRDLSIAFNHLVVNFLESQADKKKIADQLLLEKQSAQWQANHDVLTGLVNRREFENQLAKLWSDSTSRIHSLLYMDLDRFKIVNDTCGHYAGDELLKKVSKILHTHIAQHDTLARLGGDEFAIILHESSEQEALDLAKKIFYSIQEFCFIWEERSFSIGISIGVLSFQSHSDSLNSVLRAADTACYAAKNRGRNQIYVMENKDLELAQQSQEMNWLAAINQALELDRFLLYYQKIQPLQHQSHNDEHYEVLLRMQGNDGHVIPPMAFIPIAERYQIMNKIDRWVIKNLLATQGHHYRQRGKTLSSEQDSITSLYTINLSGETLNDPNFVEFVKDELHYHQILPQLICFEITETVAISNLEQARRMILQLREIGCRFALDDFGTGMSSYAYLKSLPVDFLKIDGTFIRELLEDPINSAIIKSFHQVAQVMGIQTIAEFVDSEAKLLHLQSLGIDYAQGYWIDKPKSLPRPELIVTNQITSSIT